MMSSRGFTLLLVLGLLVTLAVPATALASHVQCGDVITANTKLDSDIGPCPGDGLIIGADNVVLNLNGHTITGTGIGAGIRAAQVTGVVIKNGTVSGFNTGVQLDEADGNTVRVITATANLRQGINVSGSDNNSVVLNTLTGNGGDGIRLGLSSGNSIRRNTVTGNAFGIGIADASANNLLGENHVAGNTAFGIALFSGASGNRLNDNTVLTTAAGDGIVVAADATNTKVRGSTANENADDGIDVDSSSTLIAGNTANDNGDLGIEAVAGVKDGGGNSASGNGNPAQCVGVSCN
jgi:parallel beta-helix repeat protein